MVRAPRLLAAALAAVLVAGCANAAAVTTQDAQPLPGNAAPPTATPAGVPATSPASPTSVDGDPSGPGGTRDTALPTAASPPTSLASTAPIETMPPMPTVPDVVAPTVDPDQPLDEAWKPGPDKPEQEWDDFITLTIADLQHWWGTEYPAIYGEPYRSLQGGVFPAYPSRPDDIPSCGGSPTTYQVVAESIAFYCSSGDFITYDDAADGQIASIVNTTGLIAVGIMLSHEWGHAIQFRNGTFDGSIDTIYTEQQADCWAGAWFARATRGEVAGISLDDHDMTAALLTVISVRDLPGSSQMDPNGHGSGFDRVGAFQVGFTDGAARCAELIDDPLPLMPNTFDDVNDQATQGNSPFDPDPQSGTGILSLVRDDLNLFWNETITDPNRRFGDLDLVPVDRNIGTVCPDPTGNARVGAVYCPSERTVVYDEPNSRALYDEFGDFTVGYQLASAWSEAALTAVGNTTAGEERALLSDCLIGGWVKTIIPVTPAGQTVSTIRPGSQSRISAGDLDEAIQTAIIVADPTQNENQVGSSFEKIAAFRSGVVGGIDACGVTF